MNPLDILAHKMKWLPGFQVPIHTDLEYLAKDIVKQIPKQQWHRRKHTAPYEHTYFFETFESKQRFENEIRKKS